MMAIWVGGEEAPVLIAVDHLIAVETRIGPPELGSLGKPVVKGSTVVMAHGVRFDVPETPGQIYRAIRRKQAGLSPESAS